MNYSTTRNKFRTEIISSALTANARLLGLVLAEHMNNDSGKCYPSITRLERTTGLSRSATKRAIKELKEAEYILVGKTHFKGQQHNTYSFKVGSERTQGRSCEDPGVGSERTTNLLLQPSIKPSNKIDIKEVEEGGLLNGYSF